MREAKRLAKGTRGTLAGRAPSGGVLLTPPEDPTPTLEDLGIDKNLADQARETAAMPLCAGAQTD